VPTESYEGKALARSLVIARATEDPPESERPACEQTDRRRNLGDLIVSRPREAG